MVASRSEASFLKRYFLSENLIVIRRKSARIHACERTLAHIIGSRQSADACRSPSLCPHRRFTKPRMKVSPHSPAHKRPVEDRSQREVFGALFYKGTSFRDGTARPRAPRHAARAAAPALKPTGLSVHAPRAIQHPPRLPPFYAPRPIEVRQSADACRSPSLCPHRRFTKPRTKISFPFPRISVRSKTGRSAGLRRSISPPCFGLRQSTLQPFSCRE